MRNIASNRGRSGWRRALPAIALASLVLVIPGMAVTALRPLVPDMLDNLGAINRIGEAVALEDYEQIVLAARGLISRASSMQYLDLGALGLDARRDPEWDAYLIAQRQAAEAIESAARNADAAGVVEASQRLVGNACLACHASFRDPGNLLRPAVLYMTTFLASWRDMNRGLVLQDFTLVGQRAREVGELSQTMAAGDVIENAFGLGGSKQQRIFREFLTHVTDSSARIDAAAGEKDVVGVLESMRHMWTEGCISCHEKFRR
jgi:cytochrome c556